MQLLLLTLGEQSELVMVQWLAKPYRSGEKLSGVEENDGKGSGGPKLPQQGEEHLVRFQIMAFLCFMNWSRIRIWSGSNSTKIHLWRMVAPGALRKLVHGNLGAGYSRCRLAQRPPDSKKQQSTFCKVYKNKFCSLLDIERGLAYAPNSRSQICWRCSQESRWGRWKTK